MVRTHRLSIFLEGFGMQCFVKLLSNSTIVIESIFRHVLQSIKKRISFVREENCNKLPIGTTLFLSVNSWGTHLSDFFTFSMACK